jgi:cystathionine beta-lyase/cystathionine gamma-synthase
LAQTIASSYEVNPKNPILDAVILTSGMNCLDNILASQLRYSCAIFHGDELYCDTPRLINEYKNSDLIRKVVTFSVRQPMDQVLLLITKHLERFPNDQIVIIIESCTNPSGEIFDFESLALIQKTIKNLLVVVDNTWLTHAIFNPFDYNVDLVYESLSKYNSGGKRIGGVIVGRSDLIVKSKNKIRLCGIHIETDVCEDLYKLFQGVNIRLTESSRLTLDFINRIKTHPSVIHIFHPSMENNEHHERFVKLKKRSHTLIPSVLLIWFHCNQQRTSKTNILKFCDQKNVGVATSYGGSRSRVDYYFHPPKDNRILLRIAIGYEADDYQQFVSSLFDLIDSFNLNKNKK